MAVIKMQDLDTSTVRLEYSETSRPLRHGTGAIPTSFEVREPTVSHARIMPDTDVEHADFQPANLFIHRALGRAESTDIPAFDSEGGARASKAIEAAEVALKEVFGPSAYVRLRSTWNEDFERIEPLLEAHFAYEGDDPNDLFERHMEFLRAYVTSTSPETRSFLVVEPIPIEE